VILSQRELRKEVDAGRIKFEPALEEKQWGEASVDLRLGTQFTRLQEISGVKLSVSGGIPPLAGFWKTINLPLQDALGKPTSFCLDPGEFVLALTHESITVPRNMIARVEGRSTYARLGVSMHQTAPWIQPGWEGRIVLEIKNSGPMAIELKPLLDRPCQVSFFKLSSPVPEALAYGSRATDRYARQTHPIVQNAKPAARVANKPPARKTRARRRARPK
jgi:dCTP deaminase